MKILFAIQGTGNGHLSRAEEIIPYLMPYGELDVLVTGTHHEVVLPYLIKYKRPGLGFTFGKKGGINYIDTVKKFSPAKFMRDVLSFPVHEYDLVINDFEPLSAWACKLRGKPCFGLSHHAAYLSDKAPRPLKRNNSVEKLFKHFAPTTNHIGFHFEEYDSFISTPVIRNAVRKLETSNLHHVTVYLPAFADSILIKHLSQIEDMRFEVFSKHCKSKFRYENVNIFPVSGASYLDSLASSCGVICGGGFEGPAEVMHLGKKLMVIPMRDQYEQKCNAAAMHLLGVRVVENVNRNFSKEVINWLNGSKIIDVSFPDRTENIIAQVVEQSFQPCDISQHHFV